MRLLVIEDDRALLTALGDGLAASGFAGDRAPGAECLARAAGGRPRARPPPLPGPARWRPGVAHGKGVRHPRVLHASRRRARDPHHAPRKLLGRDLRRALQPGRRAREPGSPKDRRGRRRAAAAHHPRCGIRPRRACAMRWPRSLRWRLTLAFTAVAGVAVLAASVGALLLVQRAVWGPIDAALAEEGETLTELGDAASAGDFSRAVARVAAERLFGDGKFVRMWAADGRVLAASGTIPPALARQAAPAVPATRYATIGVGRAAYRIIWYAAPGIGWSEIGIRVGRELRTLRRGQPAIRASAALLP